MPGASGPWRRAAPPLRIRRSRAGVRERASAVLREAAQAEPGEVFLDGTNLRAPHKAAGAKGGQSHTLSGAPAGAGAQKPAPAEARGPHPLPGARAPASTPSSTVAVLT